MSSRSPRSTRKSSLGYHSPTSSPKSSHRSHSPNSSHHHRSHSPGSHSPRSSHSPRTSHSPRSHSPKSNSSRITHSPRSSSTHSTHHSPHSSSYIAKTSYTETTTRTHHPNHDVVETSRSPHHRHREDETIVTEIRGNIHPTSPRSRQAEVLVATRESWDYEGLRRLEEKIAVEKSALIDVKKMKSDQKVLYNEALRTAEKRLADASRLEKQIREHSAERDRLLEEEKELERRRAAIHSKAVEMENIRANLLAQSVLAKEEAKVSQSLALQRSEGVKQAKALEEGHKWAIQKLEQHRMELKKKEVDVSVRGEAMPQPKEVQINVEVVPRDLPEARVDSSAVSRSAEMSSHMQETVPHHSKTVLSPRSVRASEGHRQSTTVERHVVSERDRVVL
eukprot:TRINITY_DN1447_c0_g1_i1.p1 TRINITY_DN1447_c0_g1~~TRINITY_DN1447_c0_g1_i1.p1  ORF type:complete len:393 (-),score=111.08 TRINITY_DN1447_c0_g1_i1:223-1401(-)